jgi:hypothetical protein
MGPEEDALIVTLAADWREELSADGRGDGGAAATFILSGVQPVRAEPDESSDHSVRRDVMKGDQEDLYELTTFTQLVDAALDAKAVDVTAILNVARGEPSGPSFPREVQTVVDLTLGAERRWRTQSRAEREFSAALDYYEALARDFPPLSLPDGPSSVWSSAQIAQQIERWDRIVSLVEKEFSGLRDSAERVRRRRTKLAVLHNVLWAVHNRLEQMRRSGELTHAGARLADHIQELLREKWTFDPNRERA